MPSLDRSRPGTSLTAVHGIILGGCLLVAIALSVVMRARGGPMIHGATASLAEYLTAGFALVALIVAVQVIRPRLPEASGTGSEYWTPANRGRAILLWGVLDAAITTGVVGHFLTGGFAPIVAAGLAVLALAWYSPGRISSA